MKYKKILGLILVIIAILGVFYGVNYLKRKYDSEQYLNSVNNLPGTGIIEKNKSRLAAAFGNEELPADPESLTALLNTSIEIYGQVVDQFGDPVPNANVMLRPINRFQDSYGEREIFTDNKGFFSAKGLYGKSLGITVSKKGYLRIPALSSVSSTAMLSYERIGSGTGDRHSVPSNPIVLELLKIGFMEPMIHVDNKRWKLPLDGTTQAIALNSKEGQGAHKIEFRFKSNWNQLPMDNFINSKLFDWSLEIRIPGGGLVWDKSDVLFEAPETGYKERIRFEYAATLPREKWERMRYGRYFVKFADGSYGRIHFSIDGSSDRSPLYMESWLNLKPGSRNLATETMQIQEIDVPEPTE